MSKQNGKGNIVDLYLNGMSVTNIARRKRINAVAVYKVLNSSGVNASSALENKRLVAVERVRCGEDPTEVAIDSGRSMQWLRRSCTDHGVVCNKKSSLPIERTICQILAALQNTPKKTLEEIGDEFALTRQRIHQILTEGRNIGMLFPGRPGHPENRPHCSTQQEVSS